MIFLVLIIRVSVNVIFTMMVWTSLKIYYGLKRLAQKNGLKNKKMNGDAPNVGEIYVSQIGNVLIVGMYSIRKGGVRNITQQHTAPDRYTLHSIAAGELATIRR